MNLSEELERLAKLHTDGSLTSEEFTRAKAVLLSGQMGFRYRSVRRQSSKRFLGLPLWSIAIGPDPAAGEMRGHARGFFAFGDIATGIFAFGGLARGLAAFGGVAEGGVAVGGVAIGVVALGGAAIGLLLAIGGGAIAPIAIGGGSFGYYAMGGGAAGAHAISSLGRDPAAVDFFGKFLPYP
jgi:hypothetical protein